MSTHEFDEQSIEAANLAHAMMAQAQGANLFSCMHAGIMVAHFAILQSPNDKVREALIHAFGILAEHIGQIPVTDQQRH